MWKHTIVLTLSACAIASCAERELPFATERDGPAFNVSGAGASEGQYLVVLRGNGGAAALADRVAALGGEVVFVHEGAGIGAVRLDEGGALTLAADGSVAEVAPDDEVLLDPVYPTALEVAPEAEVASPAAPQTAFFFPRQWHLRAIAADQAWAAGRLGSANVTVAILDTGLGYTHADLVGRVDLARSVSFVPSDNALVQLFFPGAHPVADLHFHGTHVGSTVASNAIVSAGVTSGVTLIGVKVCNVNGGCPVSATLQGILYAADVGAHIANISIGGAFLKQLTGGGGGSLISIINRVTNYANKNGLTLVVAAGNSGADLSGNGNIFDLYCDATHVVCVSATGPTAAGSVNGPFTDVDASAEYTNFGSAISVAAPGGSTRPGGANGFVWAACSTFSLVIPVCRTSPFFTVASFGTSMASPHAAGVAALIAEQVGRDPSKIRARLQQSADELGKSGSDPFYGNGRVNALNATR